MIDEKDREIYAYLGDGVYAFFDGYGIWLRTGDHRENLCDDKIYLEPDILENLNFFNDCIKCKEIKENE